MFCALTKHAFNTPKDGRGIGQKQVLAQNLFSTDIQGCISVERYTDVQQLKMVQMLAQSPDFAIYICSSDTFVRLMVRKKIPRWLGAYSFVPAWLYAIGIADRRMILLLCGNTQYTLDTLCRCPELRIHRFYR